MVGSSEHRTPCFGSSLLCGTFDTDYWDRTAPRSTLRSFPRSARLDSTGVVTNNDQGAIPVVQPFDKIIDALGIDISGEHVRNRLRGSRGDD